MEEILRPGAGPDEPELWRNVLQAGLYQHQTGRLRGGPRKPHAPGVLLARSARLAGVARFAAPYCPGGDLATYARNLLGHTRRAVRRRRPETCVNLSHPAE